MPRTSAVPHVARRADGRRSARRLLAGVVVAVALAGACTEPIASTPPGAVTLPAELDAGALAQLLDYTGGHAGTATGDPVYIGYVNQEGGTPSFAEATFGADAGVDLVNTRLGGVGGRPIVLVKCAVRAEEDGLGCAQKMVADDRISLVVTGALFFGNGPLLDTLKGKKPVYLANPLTPSDFFDTDAYAFTPGAPGVVEGLLTLIATMLRPRPTTVALVYASNAAGEAAKVLVEGRLPGAGIKVTSVAVADTAGPQEYGPAIRAAGAETADVFMPLVTAPGCIGTYDALQALGVSTTVVTTGLCFGLSMQQHLRQIGVGGDAPNGWFFGAYGYTYFIPGTLVDNYLVAAKSFARAKGLDNVDYTGFAGPLFSTMLLLAKFVNSHGPTPMGPDDWRSAARAFPGPVLGVAGPMTCGANPIYPSLCGTQMGVQQYLDGRWVPIADAYNGHPITVNQPFAGSTVAGSTVAGSTVAGSTVAGTTATGATP